MEFARKFSFHRIFTSHMVLQRERPIRLSGKAEPGRFVTLSFAGRERCVAAEADGEWFAEFPAMQAGGPYSLTLTGDRGVSPVTLDDILIGEVWMCTGQSNMEMPVYSENPFWRTLDAVEELKKADHPRIRLYNSMLTRRLAPDGPLTEENGNGWQLCNAETIALFSACGYFFGRTLEEDLDVPVGLIATAWGGTIIEAWISQRKFREKSWQPFIEQTRIEVMWNKLQETGEFRQLFDWLKNFDALGKADPALFQPETDDSSWQESTAPCLSLPVPGRYMIRATFDLPETFSGKDLTLKIGVFNDTDRTFFNGEFIGATGMEQPAYWNICRQYRVPARLLRAGRNCVGIEVDNHYSVGSANLNCWQISDGEQTLEFQPACRWINLFTVPAGFPPRPNVPTIGADRTPTGPNYSSTLFNGMLFPWFRYTVRGTIWYQGCSNNGEFTYYPLHKMLIDDLREHWNDPDMPFLLVQLAAFHSHNPDNRLPDAMFDDQRFPEFSPYGITREIQAELPHVRRNVGMISAFDRGDHSDIHPRDKQTVGMRLAKKAEQMVYGREVIADGPTFAGIRKEGSAFRILFRNTGSGLTTSDGKAPLGFALGSRTGGLYPAEAVIDGDSVVLSTPLVVEPQRARYAFTGYCRVNLCNKEGFPALPFRSDKPDYEAMFPEIP